MFPPDPPEKKIAHIQDLIARAEERVRNIQARAEPGTSRIVQQLTNRIRQYRRDLHKVVTREPHLATQKLHQKRKMQQANNNDPADRSDELPAKQDQGPRKPASKQGIAGGH